jgi:hypothetical protein
MKNANYKSGKKEFMYRFQLDFIKKSWVNHIKKILLNVLIPNIGFIILK